MRNELICTVANGAVHFTAPKLLQGENNNLWFLLSTKGSELDFKEVEAILLFNKVANNVSFIEKLRDCGNSSDYKIIYNEFVKGESDSLLAELLKSRM